MDSCVATLSNFFEFLSMKYGTEFKIDELYELPADTLFIKDENSKLVEINGAIKKSDEVIRFELEDGISFRCAKKHILPFENEDRLAINFTEADSLMTATGNVKIAKIIDESLREDMFDLSVNSDTHLYQTVDGVIHHNTSFMQFFAKLVGIEMVIVEAPHISEEHVINIPFIVLSPTGRETSSSFQMTDEHHEPEYKIVLSKSNLLTQLQQAHKIPDAQYLKTIAGSSADFQTVFKNLGGSATKIPDDIAEVREKTTSILFLDEYFRQSSPRIRGILRGILNRKVGLDDLPADVYVVFASNLHDSSSDSVVGISSNEDFDKVEFGTPNKDDWFSYLIAKFEKDETVKLKPEVVNKFHKLLSEKELNNVDKSVRTSPRRWEQLLLYINASLPVKDAKDAKGLMTNVKHNFQDYLTGEYSSLGQKVAGAVAELIKETSGLDVDATDTHPVEEWRETIEHQIQAKIKLGKHRKYIPIISGAPGIGKTAHVYTVAHDLGLGLIYVECSTLDAEDVIGIPLSKGKGDQIEVKFSEPKLYKIIHDKAKSFTDLAGMKSGGTTYKYLIMFDELNSTKPKVFNAIRRVLLEGKFGDGHELPVGSIVIAAINPKRLGVEDLTGHVKDVVDVVDAGGSWPKLMGYLGGEDAKLQAKLPKGVPVADTVKEVLKTFNGKFRVKRSTEHPASQLHWFLNIGSDEVYMSPREYTHLYSKAVLSLASAVKKIQRDEDKYEDKPDEVNRLLREAMYEAFEGSVGFILEKHDARSPTFEKDLKTWFMSSSDLSVIDELMTFKRNKTVDFAEIASHFFNHPKESISKDPEFVNYLSHVDAAVFKEDFLDFLTKELKTVKDVLEHVLTKKSEYTKTTKQGAKVVKTELSKFEHFMHEVAEASERHKMSYDKIEMIRDVVIDFLGEKMGDENMEEMMVLSRGLNKMVKELVK